MPRKKKTEVQEEAVKQDLRIKTLDIKSGDWIKTGKDWREAVSDAYRDNDGIICVEVANYGVYKYSSTNQNTKIKR